MRSPQIVRQPVVLGPSSGSARTLYDGTMIAIAIFAATLIIMPEKPVWAEAAHVAVWAVFATDYLTRLALSTDRRAFLRRNVIEGFAALPLDLLQVARVLRLVSFIRILRPAAALARVGRHLRAIGATNGLSWALLATFVISVAGALTMRSSSIEALRLLAPLRERLRRCRSLLKPHGSLIIR